MNDILGARYWYNPTKQYGYEFYLEDRDENISLNSFDLDEYYGDITVVGNIHEDPEFYEQIK